MQGTQLRAHRKEVTPGKKVKGRFKEKKVKMKKKEKMVKEAEEAEKAKKAKKAKKATMAKMAEKKTKEKEADNERISVLLMVGSICEVTFRV